MKTAIWVSRIFMHSLQYLLTFTSYERRSCMGVLLGRRTPAQEAQTSTPEAVKQFEGEACREEGSGKHCQLFQEGLRCSRSLFLAGSVPTTSCQIQFGVMSRAKAVTSGSRRLSLLSHSVLEGQRDTVATLVSYHRTCQRVPSRTKPPAPLHIVLVLERNSWDF
jgi:hypothetical protein